MTTPQAILIVGGMLNFLISSLAGYAVFWLRARDPKRVLSRYAAITHTSAVTNGLLLFAYSIAIAHTGFVAPINIAIACTEVLATLIATVRNITSWRRGFNDSIAEGTELGLRTRGLVNVIHFFNSAAVLYGVTRTALGI